MFYYFKQLPAEINSIIYDYLDALFYAQVLEFEELFAKRLENENSIMPLIKLGQNFGLKNIYDGSFKCHRCYENNRQFELQIISINMIYFAVRRMDQIKFSEAPIFVFCEICDIYKQYG